VERHTASPALLANAARSGLASNGDESVSVLVLEEDAARIQAFAPGLQLEQCLQNAAALEEKLFPAGAVAYHETLGYLTACPSNLGTGMRASVTIHLPGLTTGPEQRLGHIKNMTEALSKNGMTLRGFYGEGSKAAGCFYQLSNQVTLGQTEEELIAALQKATERIAVLEQAARQRRLKREGMKFEDALMRAVGILNNARLLGLEECMRMLSAAWLAADLGLYKPPRPLKTLLTKVQPATLKAGFAGDDRGVEALRAEVVRGWFAPSVVIPP